MANVTLRTGFIGTDGREEVLTEYLCDWPDCPNIAVHLVGIIRELRMTCAMCEEHTAMIRARARKQGP